MLTAQFFLMLLAIICAALATAGVSVPRINLIGATLLFWLLATMWPLVK